MEVNSKGKYIKYSDYFAIKAKMIDALKSAIEADDYIDWSKTHTDKLNVAKSFLAEFKSK